MTVNLWGWLIDIQSMNRVRGQVKTWGVLVSVQRQDTAPFVRGLSLSWVSEEAR